MQKSSEAKAGQGWSPMHAHTSQRAPTSVWMPAKIVNNKVRRSARPPLLAVSTLLPHALFIIHKLSDPAVAADYSKSVGVLVGVHPGRCFENANVWYPLAMKIAKTREEPRSAWGATFRLRRGEVELAHWSQRRNRGHYRAGISDYANGKNVPAPLKLAAGWITFQSPAALATVRHTCPCAMFGVQTLFYYCCPHTHTTRKWIPAAKGRQWHKSTLSVFFFPPFTQHST